MNFSKYRRIVLNQDLYCILLFVREVKKRTYVSVLNSEHRTLMKSCIEPMKKFVVTHMVKKKFKSVDKARHYAIN